MKSTTLALLLAMVNALKVNQGSTSLIHSFEDPKAEAPKAEGDAKAEDGNATVPAPIPLDNTTKAESAKAAAAAIR